MSRSIKWCLCVKGLHFRKKAERDLWNEQQESFGMHQKRNCKGRILQKGVVKGSEKMPNRFEPN